MSVPSSSPLLIRADATPQMGTGHVMRCLALAQAWRERGGQVVFAPMYPLGMLENRLSEEGFAVSYLPTGVAGNAADSLATIRLAHRLHAIWVVVDGYQFGAAYQKQLKEAGLGVLFIDDNGHAEHYYADLVLNQNIYAHAYSYADSEPHTELLMGSSYALLRREFWPWRDWNRSAPAAAHNILVTLGGSDPENVTLTVIHALRMLPQAFEAVVLVGGQNPHYVGLSRAAERDSRLRLRHHISDMPDLMAWSDLAIAAAGSTTLELAYMGVPMILITLAENQKAIAKSLAEQNIASSLGWFADLQQEDIARAVSQLRQNRARREQMSRLGGSLVDGRGAQRTIKLILDKAKKSQQTGLPSDLAVG